MKKLLIIFSIIFLSFNYSISQTWDQKLNGRNVWSLAKDNQGNIFAGGLTGVHSRIWKSTTGGDSWDTIYIGAGQTMWDFSFDQSNNIYVANFSNGLLKSTNNGLNFTLIPNSAFNNKNLQGVECGSAGYVFVTTASGFFRSTDFGQTFTETALTGLNNLPVLVDKDSSNIVYVGVSSAGGTGIGFYRSTDNGLTFSSNLNPGKNGYNLFQVENNDLYMITTTLPYNFDKSTDKGLTWTTISNTALSQRGITKSKYTGYFYTAGNGGIFRSVNNGLKFINHNFTFSATPIMSVRYGNMVKILAGTTGSFNGGVWILNEGPAPIINVNLKVIVEGLYNPLLNQLNRRDTVTLYLRDGTSPYRMRDSARAVIDSISFSGLYTFFETPSGTYYLVVRHFNSIETWSKSGGELLEADSSIYNYDFTTTISQAYGNNLNLIGGKYCVYSADVNQDGIVDGSDGALVDNDAFNFVTGYVVTDLNGDGIVDGSDYLITDNNSAAFIGVIRP